MILNSVLFDILFFFVTEINEKLGKIVGLTLREKWGEEVSVVKILIYLLDLNNFIGSTPVKVKLMWS